jgi:F0F1-type ATP synthase membrane subunit b/b'
VSPALATFLFEAANFLVLAAALGWVLFRPIRGALQAEQERHASAQQEANASRAEAEKLLKQAREQHEKLQGELEQTRARMLAEAQEKVAALEREARDQRLVETRELERKREAALGNELQAQAEALGHIAAESVRGLLQSIAGPDLERALVAAAIRELESLPGEARAGCVVETARPLQDESRLKLSEALGPDFEERDVPELGAGLRITTRAGQVDASALALSRAAAERVAQQAAPRAGGFAPPGDGDAANAAAQPDHDGRAAGTPRRAEHG